MSKRVKAWCPGPWRVTTSVTLGLPSVDAIDPKDGLNFEVCTVLGQDNADEETVMSRANAALIAAAPELLEACEELVYWCDYLADPQWEGSPAQEQVLAAIAKAYGEQD